MSNNFLSEYDHMLRCAPDEGWASYCGKNLHMATPFVRQLLCRHGSAKLLVAFGGNPLFVSRELSQRAKESFEASRWRLRLLRSMT
jgi:hypothetical protein